MDCPVRAIQRVSTGDAKGQYVLRRGSVSTSQRVSTVESFKCHMQTIEDAERIGEIKVVDYTSEVVAMTK